MIILLSQFICVLKNTAVEKTQILETLESKNAVMRLGNYFEFNRNKLQKILKKERGKFYGIQTKYRAGAMEKHGEGVC